MGSVASSTFHTLHVLGVAHACSSVGAPSRPGCPLGLGGGTSQQLLGPGLLTLDDFQLPLNTQGPAAQGRELF